ncbi:hypothetical protein ACFYOD_35795 [Streptomyces sp. NPDC006703]|uniref:hypothetical protein n=1 Tax=Streptomyces sp. NPDC006703 TaxID=3364759 RepID=UPI0036C4CC56
MNDHRDLPPERRAVRLAARHLTEEAPDLTAGSADALRVGLASRATTLRQAALAAWRSGIPPEVIAEDSRLPLATVLPWIDTDE